jgi:C-terminal processing protease CtpA/Prc
MTTIVLILVLALPAVAGDKGDKAHKSKQCSYSTQECLDAMAKKFEKTGWVGIEMDVDEATKKYKIVKVIPNSPAEKAGIQPGDILFAMYGIEFTEENNEALKKARADWQPGQEVVYTVLREGNDKEITLTLGAMPADVLASWIGRHLLEQHTQPVEDVADATSP